MLQLGSSPVVAQIGVTLPTVSGEVDDIVFFPITAGDMTGQGVVSYSFTIIYDSNVLTITGSKSSGTFSAEWFVVANTTVPGEITVAAAGITPLSGSGILLELQAEYAGEGTSPLTWTEFLFNEGVPTANAISGSVLVKTKVATETLTWGRIKTLYK